MDLYYNGEKMKKIVIIGVGQLGSRHLQGVSQADFDISIEVVDPNISSLKIAKERYEEITDKQYVQEIKFLKSIDELSSQIDLAIIATSANIRSKVIKELVVKKDVKNLILEKILFQTLEEYDDIEVILEENHISCWVNHPRRMFPIYENLKDMFIHSSELFYSFSASNWGLACNALHFIDHLSFLTNENSLELNCDFLDKKIYSSNREGFIEFNGLLAGKLGNHKFVLYSNRDDFAYNFTISDNNKIVNIDENNNKIIINYKDGKIEIIEEKIVYYQSELSQLILRDLFINNVVKLPTFKEAKSLHIPFIESLLSHLEKIDGKKHKICPIT